ncbi:MAG: histidine--tRNA ligase [Defluviitaleaceae bacterium]|nr:histidine--tRNA ligase [Defluviitaleaceae bacterium]
MIQAPRGTHDVYGDDMQLWRYIEDEIRTITATFGYQEVRTPSFEHTELFLRGVGDTTDVVQKEMYTFEDKGGRSISLRPEQTAGVARAYVERGMANKPQPIKLFYIGPNFRYETPQHGRYRQHHQFGIEVFGAYTPATEAEVISLGHTLISRLGVENVSLHINSIGCEGCRPVYHQRLKDFLSSKLDKFCKTCQERFGKNPLRILDCKEERCQAMLTEAPLVTEALDDECRAHFEELQFLLTQMEIPFTVDPKVVRGLDYYTRTVFEFIAPGFTVLGGGRYDGLIAQVGGAATAGVGFGMGIERLVLQLKEQNNTPVAAAGPVLFIGHADPDGARKAHQLAYTLRKAGIQAESDIVARSVKAQMKYANKIQAKYSMILGCSELAENAATLKNMDTGEQALVGFDGLVEYLG